MSELWQLPGPLHFLSTIVSDLAAGRSCIVVRPNGAPPPALEAQIRSALGRSREWSSMTLEPFDGAHTAQRYVDDLFERFELRTPDEAARRTVGTLAEHPDWHYRSLIVDATGASDASIAEWWRFVTQYAAASQAVNPHERTPVLTIVDGRGARELPEENVLLTTRWWWSVVQPLDSAVHLSNLTRGRDHEPSLLAACTEIAAFDLELAAELAMQWDGTVQDVPDLLSEYASRRSEQPSTNQFRLEPPDASTQPRPAHLSAWNDALLAHWAGRPTWHLAALEHSDDLTGHIEKLVWKSQLANLLPELETYRLDIARWCDQRRHHLTDSHFDGVDILELEYGSLLRLMRKLPRPRVDWARREVLAWMYEARNALAHARALEPDAIVQGRNLMRAVTSSTG